MFHALGAASRSQFRWASRSQPTALVDPRWTARETGGMSSFLYWIGLGLVVGVLAKWIMPGRDPGGIIVTILIGIAGAFVGGYLGTRFGIGSVTGFNLMSIAVSTGGALLLLLVYRLLTKSR